MLSSILIFTYLLSTSATSDPEYKDIIYKPEFNLTVRLYLLKDTPQDQKLPLIVYFHGGGFLPLGLRKTGGTHEFLMRFVPEANVIAVSVNYRLWPSQLPIPYDDSWDALKWVASHLSHNGPDPWLNQHADFEKVYLAGDSAGANIVHQMALKLGVENDVEVEGFSVQGTILANPYMWGVEPLHGEPRDSISRWFYESGWRAVCSGCDMDNPWINPGTDPNLSKVASPRVQIFVSENDELKLRERGWFYASSLRRSGWSGHQHVVDFQNEGHVFHMKKPDSVSATILRRHMAEFINQDWPVNDDSSVQLPPIGHYVTS